MQTPLPSHAEIGHFTFHSLVFIPPACLHLSSLQSERVSLQPNTAGQTWAGLDVQTPADCWGALFFKSATLELSWASQWCVCVCVPPGLFMCVHVCCVFAPQVFFCSLLSLQCNVVFYGKTIIFVTHYNHSTQLVVSTRQLFLPLIIITVMQSLVHFECGTHPSFKYLDVIIQITTQR